MKRKLISTVAALAMTASMSMPVFAATPANTQTSDVPVVGNIGRWKDSNTNIKDPTNTNSGSKGENGEVNTPDNLTDINVTVPTSMTFDVVTNTKDNNPVLASGAYQVTNNGQASVNMTGQYKVTADGGIDLVNVNSVTADGHDNKVELGLNLDYGNDADNANREFIGNIKNMATSTAPITLTTNQSTTLKFSSNEQGMSDVKQENLAGTFKDQTKVTQGDLVLTFTTTQP